MSTSASEKQVKETRRNTHRKCAVGETICIALEGIRREYSIAELCRCKGVNQNLYYRWSKDSLKADNK